MGNRVMAQRPRKPRIDVEATTTAADLWVGRPLGSPSTLIPGVPVAGIASGTLADAVSFGDALDAVIIKAPKRIVRPKTKLGRAFLAQGAAIVLQTQSMISVVDVEIARLQEQRRGLNDLDHIEKLDASITNLDALKKGLVNLQSAAVDFPREKVAEGTLAKVAKGFKEQFGKFWKKDGAEVVGGTTKVILCCSGYVLAHLLGVPVPVASVIACIPAHKEISELLKASRGPSSILGRS
jgi:hypothetical protein